MFSHISRPHKGSLMIIAPSVPTIELIPLEQPVSAKDETPGFMRDRSLVKKL